jgi:hypothetical protein
VATKNLAKWDTFFTKQGNRFPLADIKTYLEDMKKQYPKSDTILVIPCAKIS